jgi:hypothetical protein
MKNESEHFLVRVEKGEEIVIPIEHTRAMTFEEVIANTDTYSGRSYEQTVRTMMKKEGLKGPDPSVQIVRLGSFPASMKGYVLFLQAYLIGDKAGNEGVFKPGHEIEDSLFAREHQKMEDELFNTPAKDLETTLMEVLEAPLSKACRYTLANEASHESNVDKWNEVEVLMRRAIAVGLRTSHFKQAIQEMDCSYPCPLSETLSLDQFEALEAVIIHRVKTTVALAYRNKLDSIMPYSERLTHARERCLMQMAYTDDEAALKAQSSVAEHLTNSNQNKVD